MNPTSRTAAVVLTTLLWMASALSAQQTSAASDVSATAGAAQNQSPAHGISKVRIVRISETKGAANGEVQLDRDTGNGFENAITNLPIVEGCKLRTGAGVAEVEFEDNSTLRLAPGSLVEFTQLELLPSGAKLSTMNVVKGVVYVSLTPTKGNRYTLTFGQQKVQLQPSSHVRLTVDPGQADAKLAVFDGEAQLESQAGVTDVDRKRTLTVPLEGQGQPVMAKNVKQEEFDSWDQSSAEYHKQFAGMSAVASSPYSYGVSDLMYYGSFNNVGGCGQMWQPYFASASWSPFANGTWAYYPGAGYSWVSPYPWGWMPFHYGSWAYCQGAGWGWQPGGVWNGLSNSPVVGGASPVTVNPPRPPIGVPRKGGSTLLSVDNKPLNVSTLGPDRFIFRSDSAGMGIPRGSLGRLDKFSTGVARHGTASTPVYFESTAMVARPGQMDGGRMAGPGAAPVTSTMRRGYAPAAGAAPSPMGEAGGFDLGQRSAGMSAGTSTARSASGSTGSSGSGRPH